MTGYGVYVSMDYEAWLDQYDTLEEAQAAIQDWRTQKPSPPVLSIGLETEITLVKLISEHKQGDLLENKS